MCARCVKCVLYIDWDLVLIKAPLIKANAHPVITNFYSNGTAASSVFREPPQNTQSTRAAARRAACGNGPTTAYYSSSRPRTVSVSTLLSSTPHAMPSSAKYKTQPSTSTCALQQNQAAAAADRSEHALAFALRRRLVRSAIYIRRRG